MSRLMGIVAVFLFSGCLESTCCQKRLALTLSYEHALVPVYEFGHDRLADESPDECFAEITVKNHRKNSRSERQAPNEMSSRCERQKGVSVMYKISPKSWWLTILTLGPLLGSFITGPAAMTICALLLRHRFYSLMPSRSLKYATLDLLFVNISVGGVITHFGSPPVVIVASVWNWNLVYMLTHFGWKAVIGIILSNSLYLTLFRREFARLAANAPDEELDQEGHRPIPGGSPVSISSFSAG
jgi:hypothetical protein